MIPSMLRALLLGIGLVFAGGVSAEPLTLERALELAKTEDVRRASVRLDVAQAGHAAHRATARISPRFNVGFTLTQNAKEIEVNDRVVSPLVQPQGTFNGRLTLFSGADIPDALAAWTARDAVRADATERELDLAVDVALRYLAAAEARSLVDTQRSILEWAEENVRVAEARAKNDEGLQLDVEVARGEMLRVEAALALAEGNAASANAALALRLGLEADADLDARCDACVPAPPEGDPARRPLLEARELGEDAASTRKLGAWLALLPTLEVSGNARLSEPTLFNPEPLWWNAQLVASWSIFNGTADAANVLGARTTLRQASLQRESARRQVLEERAAASASLNAAAVSAQAERARAEASGRALGYVEARYRQGLERALDVADAARQRALAEQAAVRARFGLERARLAVWRARGEIPGGES
jgi:outer membrane protein TolC